jgi:hypothetical protein
MSRRQQTQKAADSDTNLSESLGLQKRLEQGTNAASGLDTAIPVLVQGVSSLALTVLRFWFEFQALRQAWQSGRSTTQQPTSRE